MISCTTLAASRPVMLHNPMTAEFKTRLHAQALTEGFSAMGICAPDAIPEAADRLRSFLAADRHGQMQWLADRESWRASPATLWPDARSVIMLAETYTPETDPLDVLNHPDRAAISVYAQGRDYHDLVKKAPQTPRPLADRRAAV